MRQDSDLVSSSIKKITMNKATHSTRREFISRTALLPLCLAGLPATGVLAALEPIKRVGQSSLKPSLNVYSFLDQLDAHAQDVAKGVDLFQVIDFAAKQNFDAVDITGYFFPGYPKVPEDSYIYKVKRYVHDLGLGISGTGVRNDFVTADKTVRDTGVQLTKKWIEVAAKLGAPTIRLFAGPQSPYKNWQEASGNASRDTIEEWMAENLRECAEHAMKFGVIIAVQNHGDFISTGEQHLSLLRRVDHEWCMALVDTGKYLTQDPYADIALMVPYAANWQIKETMGSAMKTPRTDFKKLVTIIRQGGYRGYVPIETLTMARKDYDPFVEAAKALAALREAIAATA